MIRRITLVLVLVLPTAIRAQARLARPVIDKLPGGGTRVTNPGPTSWADTSGWKLVSERTVQPPEGSPGLLEAPAVTALASDGRLVTLDYKTPTIRVYDQGGKFLRSIGRRGEGPGEYKQPFIALDRDTLFIYDPALRRISVMTLDGKTVRTMPTTANDYYPLFIDARGRFAMRYSVRGPNGMNGRWVFQTRAGQRVDSIVAPQLFPEDNKSWKVPSAEETSEWDVPFPTFNRMTLLPTGGAVYGRTDRYTLVMTRTGRDTVHLFGRINPPAVPIPAPVRDSALQAEIRQHPQLQTVAKLSDLPTTYALWRTLDADASGNIWVGARTTRPDQMRFDVFTPDGVFLGAVAAPFAPTATVTFHGDRISVIDVDDDDLPRIRIFHIDRRGK